MSRIISLTVAMILLASASLVQAQITQNVSLIQFQNTTGTTANKFSLTLGGITASDLYLDGFFNSDYGAPAVSTDVGGLVHLTWTGGTTPAGAWDSFGYALRGGVTYTTASASFFEDTTPIVVLPTGFQGWDIFTGEPRDTINNDGLLPINLTRTSGSDPYRIESFFDIFTELQLPDPPNPVPLEITPLSLSSGESLRYTWPAPSSPERVFMFYNLTDTGGSAYARFHNVATVLPEPSLMMLPFAIGLLLIRRRG